MFVKLGKCRLLLENEIVHSLYFGPVVMELVVWYLFNVAWVLLMKYCTTVAGFWLIEENQHAVLITICSAANICSMQGCDVFAMMFIQAPISQVIMHLSLILW